VSVGSGLDLRSSDAHLKGGRYNVNSSGTGGAFILEMLMESINLLWLGAAA
jgi:hypothetical protein